VNHYPRHIGDYLKDTSHLSLLEHGAYARLLDVYYTREGAIPSDQTARLVGARTKEERAAVDSVLAEFFVMESDGWHQKRADEEIAAYLAGEPEREVKKTNESMRMQRHREERAGLFAQLHAVGISADWNIKMADLRALVQRHCNVTGDDGLPLPATPPVTAPATPATATRTTTIPNSIPNIKTSGGIPPPSTTDGEGNPLPPLPDEPASIADLSNYLTRRGMQPQRLAYAPNRILLNRWLTEGVTWSQLDAAYAEAERTLKGEPPAAPGYLDTILKRLSTQQTRRSIHDERAETIRAFTTPSAPEQRTERDITDVTERVD